jgi:hypothetical protein
MMRRGRAHRLRGGTPNACRNSPSSPKSTSAMYSLRRSTKSPIFNKGVVYGRRVKSGDHNPLQDFIPLNSIQELAFKDKPKKLVVRTLDPHLATEISLSLIVTPDSWDTPPVNSISPLKYKKAYLQHA